MSATVDSATRLPLELVRRGKVRDTYLLGEHLLMVASDRISAFDVILPTPIPGKGKLLTQLSRFWFERTRQIAPNHLVSTGIEQLPEELKEFVSELDGRFMLVRRAERIDIECVVRGYLDGSAWAEYRSDGTIAGEPMPAGLRRCERLPEAIFTPAIKADEGHDQNISVAQLRTKVGNGLAGELERISKALYAFAAGVALARGIIIADTKFEFGFVDGELTLIDEALTPDSSRFWDASDYEPGRAQPSFDKQFLRDWLETTGWDKTPPGPELPIDVVNGTLDRYREAFERLTGATWSEFGVNNHHESFEAATGVDFDARVVVMPKPGVNDPEGEAILGGLHSLGYSEVDRVRAGRVIRLRLTAPDQTTAEARAHEMADRLLANPVIESFEVEVEPARMEASR